jgi:hypothetical protein
MATSDSGVETDVMIAPITVTLDSIERMVGAGSLRLLAHCTILFGDVELKCCGIQVIRDTNGWQARSPTYRGANGISRAPGPAGGAASGVCGRAGNGAVKRAELRRRLAARFRPIRRHAAPSSKRSGRSLRLSPMLGQSRATCH